MVSSLVAVIWSGSRSLSSEHSVQDFSPESQLALNGNRRIEAWMKTIPGDSFETRQIADCLIDWNKSDTILAARLDRIKMSDDD